MSRRPAAPDANAYTREVRLRRARREDGLDVETVRGLHRNAAESAFASLMLAPGRYRAAAPAPSAAAGPAADAATGLSPRRRGRFFRLACAAAAVAAVLLCQLLIFAGWWWVCRRGRP